MALPPQFTKKGDEREASDNPGEEADEQHALALLKRVITSPQGQAALKIVERELHGEDASKKNSSPPAFAGAKDQALSMMQQGQGNQQ